jgi:hypothetical protein
MKGGFISGALKWIIFFLQRLGNCGNFKQGNPSKEVAGKMRSACAFCGSTEDLTQDHIIPASRGGPTAFITNNSSVNRAI